MFCIQLDSLQAGLDKILEKRNKQLQDYMFTSYGIPEKNIIIKTADKQMLNSYTDDDKYKIEMTLPGTEKEVQNSNQVN